MKGKAKLAAAALALLMAAPLQAGNGRGGGEGAARHEQAREHGRGPGGRGLAGRGAGVPPGHLPAPGQCRRWNPSLPPGHQPPAVPCGQLRARDLRPGEVILDSSGAYDPDGDWKAIERDRPGSVPERILDIFEEIIHRELERDRQGGKAT